VIVGDVDGPSTVKAVQTYFGSVTAVPLPARLPVHLTPLKPATLRLDSDKPFTIAALAYRFPGYRDKDYAAGQILESVLSSQRAGLYGLVAAGKALQASFTDFDTHPLAGSAAAFVVVPVTTKADDALALARGVLDNYRKNGVPAELVEAEKKRAIAQAQYKANSIEGLAFQWSEAVAVEGRSSPDEILGAIKGVTVADVNRVLRTYVDPAHEIVGIAAPKNAAALQASSGSSAAGGNENKPTLLHHDPLPAWALVAFRHVSVPASTISPVDIVLSNGIRLIVVPEHVSNTVVVRGSINSREAMQAPPGKDGIGEVTSGLLPFGTTTLDRLALRGQLDTIAAEVTAGTTFSLTTLAQNFDRGVALLADEELHPAFPAAAFDAVKAAQVGSVQGVVTSPEHLAQVALDKALYPPGDPSQRFATPQTVSSLTPTDVKNFYAGVYRPDMTTIVVVGDVEPERAKKTFETYFGGWKTMGPKPAVDLPAVPDNAAADMIVPDPQRIQSQVRLAQVSAITRTDPDFAPLSVANESFGGGGSSILFHDVRDVHGLVYGVFSRAGFERERSTFEVQFASDPGKIAQAQALITADLNELSQKGLDPSELSRGKASLVSQLPMRVASFTGIARQLIAYAQFGLPLDQAAIDARTEIGVTNEQLKAAVSKWIRPSGFVRVILGPGPT